MKNFLLEIFHRVRAAILIIIWGDLVNGKIRHLQKAMNELDYIVLHADEMSKEQILGMLTNPSVEMFDTGLKHHLAHVLAYDAGWRLLNAQARETRWHQHEIEAWQKVSGYRTVLYVLTYVSTKTIERAWEKLPSERREELWKIMSQ